MEETKEVIITIKQEVVDNYEEETPEEAEKHITSVAEIKSRKTTLLSDPYCNIVKHEKDYSDDQDKLCEPEVEETPWEELEINETKPKLEPLVDSCTDYIIIGNLPDNEKDPLLISAPDILNKPVEAAFDVDNEPESNGFENAETSNIKIKKLMNLYHFVFDYTAHKKEHLSSIIKKTETEKEILCLKVMREKEMVEINQLKLRQDKLRVLQEDDEFRQLNEKKKQRTFKRKIMEWCDHSPD